MPKKSATQEGVLPKAKTDWESIERDYRANVLSIREIAKIHDVSDKAIRNKAKANGWQRDLTAKVNEQVRTELVRTEVRAPNAQEKVRTEREIVEQAAATVVEVVRSHRKDISAGRGVIGLLMQQLTDVAGHRDEFEEAIWEETKEDETTERRNKLMKAVSIPVHASTVRDLSTALKNLVGLERQAFNIGGVSEDPPPAGESPTDAVRKDYAALSARFKEISGKADPSS